MTVAKNKQTSKGTGAGESAEIRLYTTLEKEAFADCRSLREINRPASLKTIAPDAFRNCGKLADSPVSKKMEKDAAKLADEEAPQGSGAISPQRSGSAV